jgi:putative methylase
LEIPDLAASPPTKKRLEIILDKLESHPKPKVSLEQYTIPGYLAAHILHVADRIFDDIRGHTVADLGTGTGRLAIGAKLLGAADCIGIDIDPIAIETARRNSDRAGVRCQWLVSDIHAVRGGIDTVVMNPPFGTKTPHADIQFLKHAVSISSVTYSIHKTSTRKFVLDSLKSEGLPAKVLYQARFEVLHTFRFHKKKKANVEVDLIRVRSGQEV